MTACARFRRAMEAAGFEVQHYHGRYHWTGPAVSCRNDEEFQAVLAVVLTQPCSVTVQWDDLGKGRIVYPVESEGGCDCAELKQQS